MLFSTVVETIARGDRVATGNVLEGTLVYPTILDEVPADSLLMVEGAFGPVVSLYRFSELDEIIPIINNSPYGLQAGVFTQNLADIRYLFETLDVGT